MTLPGNQMAAVNTGLPNLALLSTLPYLDGSNVTEFFDYLENVAPLANWNEEQCLAIVKLKLAGPVKSLFNSSLRDRDFQSVKEFKDVITSHFAKTKTLAEGMTEINYCVQHPSESVRDFSIRLQGLVHKTLSAALAGKQATTEFRDSLLLSQFCTGLNPQIKANVMIADPKTLEEATQVAGRVEDALKVSAPPLNAVGMFASNPFVNTAQAESIGAQQQTLADLAKVVSESTETYTRTLLSITDKLDKLTVRMNEMDRRRFNNDRDSANRGNFNERRNMQRDRNLTRDNNIRMHPPLPPTKFI